MLPTTLARQKSRAVGVHKSIMSSFDQSQTSSALNAQMEEQSAMQDFSVSSAVSPTFSSSKSESLHTAILIDDSNSFPFLDDVMFPPVLNYSSRDGLQNSPQFRQHISAALASTGSSTVSSTLFSSMNSFSQPVASDGLSFLASTHETNALGSSVLRSTFPSVSDVGQVHSSSPSSASDSQSNSLPHRAASVPSPSQCATLHKVCWHCALTSCSTCYENSRRPVSAQQPQPCHSPEQGRFVCSNCSALHKTITIPVARVLTVPISLVGEFQLELQSLATASSIAAVSSVSSPSCPAPTSSTSVDSMSSTSSVAYSPRHVSCFSGSFYTHLLNRARRFEIFDAFDLSLWAEALPFTEVFVFETEESAAQMQSMLPKYLMSPAQLVSNFDSNVILRLCSQCNSYQVQCPVQRSFAVDKSSSLDSAPSSSATRTSSSSVSACELRRKLKMLPNFYSASLCRKANASHLKKHSSKCSGGISTAEFDCSTNICAESGEAATSSGNCKKKRKSAITSASELPTEPSATAIAPADPAPASTSSAFTSALFSFPFPSFSSSQSSFSSSLPLARSSAPLHGFRARVAYRMLARHQFAMFDSYLQSFPPDRIHRPFESMCTELFRLCSELIQFMDVVYFLNATNIVESAFDIHPDVIRVISLRSHTTPVVNALPSSTYHSQASTKPLGRLPSIFSSIYELHSYLGSLLSPLVLCNPAMVLQYHLARFSVDSFSTNVSVLAGVSLDHQSKRSPTLKTISAIIAMGAECLDNVSVVREFESVSLTSSSSSSSEITENICSAQLAPSPLFVFALHVEAVTRWLLGIALIRVKHAQIWHVIKVRNGNTMLIVGNEGQTESFAQNTNHASRESYLSPSFTDHYGLDGLKVLQQSLRFAEFHASASHNSFDLRVAPFGAANELNLPPHSMKAMSLNPLLSLLFSSVEHYVLAEKLELVEQVRSECHSAFHINRASTDNIFSSSTEGISSAAVIGFEELFSWSLLSSERVDSSPQMYPYVLVTVQLASQYSPSRHVITSTSNSSTSVSTSISTSTPATSTNSVAYMQTMNQLLSKHRGESLRQLQRVCASRSHDSSSESQLQSSASPTSSTWNAENLLLRRLAGNFAPELALSFTKLPQSSDSLMFQLMPGPHYRSFEPLRFALRALSLSHEVDDLISVAYCASVLCSLLLYYLPRSESVDCHSSISVITSTAPFINIDQSDEQVQKAMLLRHQRHQCYTLALQLLQKLHQECSELLLHLDPHMSSSTSFERTRIIACQDYARFTSVQLEQHLHAGLHTPFFAGKLVQLPSEQGPVDAIVCPLSFSAPVLVLCEYPHHGEYHPPSPSELMWSVLSTESRLVSLSVQQSIMWQSLADGSYFDMPGSLLQNGFANMMLLHELQCGRYSFDRFRRDLIARAAIDVSTLPSSSCSSSSPSSASSSSSFPSSSSS